MKKRGRIERVNANFKNRGFGTLTGTRTCQGPSDRTVARACPQPHHHPAVRAIAASTA